MLNVAEIQKWYDKARTIAISLGTETAPGWYMYKECGLQISCDANSMKLSVCFDSESTGEDFSPVLTVDQLGNIQNLSRPIFSPWISRLNEAYEQAINL